MVTWNDRLTPLLNRFLSLYNNSHERQEKKGRTQLTVWVRCNDSICKLGNELFYTSSVLTSVHVDISCRTFKKLLAVLLSCNFYCVPTVVRVKPQWFSFFCALYFPVFFSSIPNVSELFRIVIKTFRQFISSRSLLFPTTFTFVFTVHVPSPEMWTMSNVQILTNPFSLNA